MGKDIKYIKNGIEAAHHSAIYKMHKYFARRPYNVFKHLIESYTKEGDVILDPFCGGGVTVIEGLGSNRKVIGVDTNPLATFITDCETTPIGPYEYDEHITEVRDYIHDFTQRYYSTRCRICDATGTVRWYELAYVVECPHGDHLTRVSNKEKYTIEGKVKPGNYVCQFCHLVFKSVDARKSDYELLKVIYKCGCSKDRQVAEPEAADIDLMKEFEKSFQQKVADLDLWYPTDHIPDNWDRQQEDCLHRKSVNNFSDFFTKRALFFNALLLKNIQSKKSVVGEDLYKMLLFTFSAVLRYTNNMTYSADNWMGGRPIAWDKHAYWLPNQFVEVNPLEYIDKRITAIKAGLKYQNEYYASAGSTPPSVALKRKSYKMIINTSADSLPQLKDESVDAVITDPPYGSNVQYGELCHYWLVWLQKDLNLGGKLFNLDDEILVQRKVGKKTRKNYDDYYRGLKAVYSESFRLLKPGGVLVFTFNNKDIRAWFAVMKACIRAGYSLDPKGIFFQDAVQNYKNTAHYRFSGTVHGDFIYTFVKEKEQNMAPTKRQTGKGTSVVNDVEEIIDTVARDSKVGTPTELFAQIIPKLIPIITELSYSDLPIDEITNYIDLRKIEDRYLRN